MATLSKIKPGDVLYDVHRERMGNTTMSFEGVWEVYVKEVHVEEGWALCSWNGNPPTRYMPFQLKRLRVSEPKKLNGHFLGCRHYHGRAWREPCTCPTAEK